MKNSFEQIYEQHKKLLWFIVWKILKNCSYSTKNSCKDDLFQESVLGLNEAYLKNDPTQKEKFSTFAFTIIYRILKRFCEKCLNYLKNMKTELTEEYEDTDPEKIYLQNQDKELLQQKVASIISQIKQMNDLTDQMILKLIIKDNCKRDFICQELNISRGILDYRLDKIHSAIGVRLNLLSNNEFFKKLYEKEILQERGNG